jgi:hypothetical protein
MTRIVPQRDSQVSAATLLSPLPGRVTATGWRLPDSLTEDDWRQAGLIVARIQGAISWCLGDWWAFGEYRYGDRKAVVERDDWEGPTFGACANAATVCRKFETSRRREVLSFSHHLEVASLDNEEDADQLLDWAEAEGATIRALREKVKDLKAWQAQGWTQSQLDRRQKVEVGLTVVASQRKGEDGKQRDAALCAWADQQRLLVSITRQTDWGNPFEMPGDGDRATVCAAFAEHYVPHRPSLLRRLPELRGKVLVCWCHPEQCHGDHLAMLANGGTDDG